MLVDGDIFRLQGSVGSAQFTGLAKQSLFLQESLKNQVNLRLMAGTVLFSSQIIAFIFRATTL